MNTLDTTIKRGFPVTAHFTICPGDEEVGLEPHIEDLVITLRDGRPCKFIKVSRQEEYRICSEIWASLR